MLRCHAMRQCHAAARAAEARLCCAAQAARYAITRCHCHAMRRLLEAICLMFSPRAVAAYVMPCVVESAAMAPYAACCFRHAMR